MLLVFTECVKCNRRDSISALNDSEMETLQLEGTLRMKLRLFGQCALILVCGLTCLSQVVGAQHASARKRHKSAHSVRGSARKRHKSARLAQALAHKKHKATGLLQSFQYQDVALVGGPIGPQAEAAREFYLVLS